MAFPDRSLRNAAIAGALTLSVVFLPLVSGSGLFGATGAFAKDGGGGSSGGSSGSGSGDSSGGSAGSSGGGSDSGGSGSGSGGSGSDSGGSGSGSGGSGSDSGGSGSGSGGSGSDGGGSSGSGKDHSGPGQGGDRQPAGRFDVIYPDGYEEQIRHGVLELRDPQGRTVIRRPATPKDYSRLQARRHK
jgi:hypothetical protein